MIHEEWMRHVVKDHPDITREQVERIRSLMNAHVDDSLVTRFERLIPELNLPDLNDRHVLAAAIRCRANVILTFNLKDFPDEALQIYGIQAKHPDVFLCEHLKMSPGIVCSAANRQRQSLKKPPMNPLEFLNALEKQGLTRTVSALREYLDLI